jgi:D-alanine-D-alanine ligase
LRLAVTYNTKKEITEEKLTPLNTDSQNRNHTSQFISQDLIQNYPERLDDTYAEWDSMDTIEAVKHALESRGHSVELVEADIDAYEKLKIIQPEFVFNLAEGSGGASRESQIPAILEMLNIHYTGSDPVSTGICHDKSRCKEILSYYNIPTPKFFITDDAAVIKDGLSYPKFTKPLHEGSSKGIYNSSVVNNREELKREIVRIKECYDQPSLIEDYLTGKEFTVALLGNGKDLVVLPIVEINLDSVPAGFNKIYSYEVKWFFDTRENKLDIFSCPAKINKALYKKIEKICRDTFNVLRLRDWTRMDVRLDENNEPNIIEVNPLPGILPDPEDNSCYPKAARVYGLDYNAMINAVLESALERTKLKKKISAA